MEEGVITKKWEYRIHYEPRNLKNEHNKQVYGRGCNHKKLAYRVQQEQRNFKN